MGTLRVSAAVPRDALVAAAVVGVLNAALWSVLVVAVRVSWDTADLNTVGEMIGLGLVNFVFGVALVAAALLTGLPQRNRTVQIVFAVLLSVVFAAVRTPIDEAIVPLATTPNQYVWVAGAAAVGYLVVISPAILVSALVARRRAEQDARIAVEADEADLRREVAEHLHGTVQNRLVIVGAGLDQLAAESEREGRPERAVALRSWARMVDTVREQDVRVISHQVFPTGLDIGLAQALGLLLDRLPASVATSFHLGEGVRNAEQDVPIADRLIVAATIEEGLTNALRHGQATRIDLSLDVRADVLTAILEDNGVGLPDGEAPESSLIRYRARLEARGGHVVLRPRSAGGTQLTVDLPLS